MRYYRGISHGNATMQKIVVIEGQPGPEGEGNSSMELPPRLDLANHSPTGLSYGYGGSGPAQCALAILADALGDDKLALKIYQDFKWMMLAYVDQEDDWVISANMVRAIARHLLARKGEDVAV